MLLTGTRDWSEQTFGDCDLGDQRRTSRLVDIGERMASQLGKSLSKCCEGSESALLGGYRLLRNEEVQPEAIRSGGFASTARQAQEHALLLAVEDTTGLWATPWRERSRSVIEKRICMNAWTTNGSKISVLSCAPR